MPHHRPPSFWNKREKTLEPQRRAKWRAWCDEQAEDLKASGVPASAFSDEDHWIGFLECGDLAPPDFDERRLSIAQKVALLRVISSWPRLLSTPVAVGLVRDILDVMDHRV